MSFQSPPAPFAAPPSMRKAPPWVYAFVVLAITGLVALVLPWFRPTLSGQTIPDEAATHSWNGVLFYVAPILMVLCAARAVTSRTNFDTLRAVCTQAIVVGVLLLVSVGVAYLRVPSNYTDWNQAKAAAAQAGLTLGRGPQPGYWLAVFVAVAFLALGIFGRLQFRGVGLRQVAMAPVLPGQYPPAAGAYPPAAGAYPPVAGAYPPAVGYLSSPVDPNPVPGMEGYEPRH
jgi:hypothetical protein